MAGNPYDDYTKIDLGDTWDTSSPSNSTCYESTCTYSTSSYVYCNKEAQEYYKKIEELLDKAIIQEMKDQWNKLKNEFKPVPKLRLGVQLRGVCFNGRGWA